MTVILQKENSILRAIAEEVPISKIGSPPIKKIINRMKKALHAEEDGVAIAAPQIGESLRIFLIAGKIVSQGKSAPDLIFINPEIVRRSKETEKMDEGCLSVRWYYGAVKRSKKVTIEAYDQNGKKFRMGRSGLLAQIFQHETDHLNGVLFTDKAEDLVELPPKEDKS
jgi:peptide deformylase